MTAVGTAVDRFAAARQVADAVLNEGAVLYPYRASSPKNHLRWQFGVLAPKPYADAEGSEASIMRAECVIEADRRPEVCVRARFLQLESRSVEQAEPDRGFEEVQSLELGDDLHTAFDESIERFVDVGPRLPDAVEVELPGRTSYASLVDPVGLLGGRLVRRREALFGSVRAEVEELGAGLWRLRAVVENLTHWRGPAASRDEIVRHSFVAVHILAAAENGAFVSMIDPPERAREAVKASRSAGCFPVLVAAPAGSDLVLASPIILYDHPAVAPESPGDMCEATEIDEILALRTLTLTEEEKREARATDPRSAAIIERVDTMPPEIFERLHGAIRMLSPAPVPAPESKVTPGVATDPHPAGPVPWWDPESDASFDPSTDTVTIGSHDVGAGTRVRLRPVQGGDAQDMFLEGRFASVSGIFNDVDGGVHLAVTIDDDPASDMQEWYGRYRYFHPWEIEVVGDGAGGAAGRQDPAP